MTGPVRKRGRRDPGRRGGLGGGLEEPGERGRPCEILCWGAGGTLAWSPQPFTRAAPAPHSASSQPGEPLGPNLLTHPPGRPDCGSRSAPRRPPLCACARPAPARPRATGVPRLGTLRAYAEPEHARRGQRGGLSLSRPSFDPAYWLRGGAWGRTRHGLDNVRTAGTAWANGEACWGAGSEAWRLWAGVASVPRPWPRRSRTWR